MKMENYVKHMNRLHKITEQVRDSETLEDLHKIRNAFTVLFADNERLRYIINKMEAKNDNV